MSAVLRTEVVAQRSTRALAERYVARFSDVLGDTTWWNGREHIPVHIVWEVKPGRKGRFDILSTVTSREA